MIETILAAVAGIVALLGGKLWMANLRKDRAETKLGKIDLAEKIYVERAIANIDAVRKNGSTAPAPDTKNRTDFEGPD